MGVDTSTKKRKTRKDSSGIETGKKTGKHQDMEKRRRRRHCHGNQGAVCLGTKHKIRVSRCICDEEYFYRSSNTNFYSALYRYILKALAMLDRSMEFV